MWPALPAKHLRSKDRAVPGATVAGGVRRGRARGEEQPATPRADAHSGDRLAVTVTVLTAAEELQVGWPVVHPVPVAMVHIEAVNAADAQEMPADQPVQVNF